MSRVKDFLTWRKEQEALEREEREGLREFFSGDCGAVRTFESGATRSPLGDKLQYEGFLNPLVLKRFAEYMHQHRKQSDGKLRAADNWQSGIPQDSLQDSLIRHIFDLWLHFRGYEAETSETYEDTLCAVMFNTMALLKHEVDKRKGA